MDIRLSHAVADGRHSVIVRAIEPAASAAETGRVDSTCCAVGA